MAEIHEVRPGEFFIIDPRYCKPQATYTPYHLACGWVARPGEGIPCDSLVTGPYFCPRCHGKLPEEPAVG